MYRALHQTSEDAAVGLLQLKFLFCNGPSAENSIMTPTLSVKPNVDEGIDGILSVKHSPLRPPTHW